MATQAKRLTEPQTPESKAAARAATRSSRTQRESPPHHLRRRGAVQLARRRPPRRMAARHHHRRTRLRQNGRLRYNTVIGNWLRFGTSRRFLAVDFYPREAFDSYPWPRVSPLQINPKSPERVIHRREQHPPVRQSHARQIRRSRYLISG